jgi:hypothetical protein
VGAGALDQSLELLQPAQRRVAGQLSVQLQPEELSS